MSTRTAEPCLDTTVQCIEACEACALECGTSGDPEREQCAILARDCADIASLSLGLMARGSQYADAICRVHADVCDAGAATCVKFPQHACCVECVNACRACAVQCRV